MKAVALPWTPVSPDANGAHPDAVTPPPIVPLA